MIFETRLTACDTADSLILNCSPIFLRCTDVYLCHKYCLTSLDRLLRNESFFKFKAKKQFNRRHTCCIPRIKFIFLTQKLHKLRFVTACLLKIFCLQLQSFPPWKLLLYNKIKNKLHIRARGPDMAGSAIWSCEGYLIYGWTENTIYQTYISNSNHGNYRIVIRFAQSVFELHLSQ